MDKRDKSDAILDLVNLENNWKGWLAYKTEDKMMYPYLNQVVEDIYEGFIPYVAFEDAFVIASERVGRAEDDFVDDCLLYVKREIIARYSTISYMK